MLLEKITERKARLLQENKVRKQKTLPQVSANEKDFTIPKSWVWARLGQLFDVQDYMRVPLNKAERALREGPYPYYGANGQVGVIDDYLFDGERVLVAEDGGFFNDPIRGVANVVRGKFWVNNHAHVLECLAGTAAKFWAAFFNRMDWQPLVRGMTRAKLNQAAMVKIPLAVPPLAEQHRIVAKVDELMTLCDQLEQQQTNSNATHQTLVETLLTALTRPTAGADEVESSAIELFFQRFDTLFTTEHSIDQLKQTILQLAVMGKLVPQDPNDEPASALQERISEEKERLIKNGKIKKQKLLPEISKEENLFTLPEGWTFCRLETVMNITGGVTKGRKLTGRTIVSVPYLRVANVQRGFLSLEQMKEIDIPEDEIKKFTVIKRDLLITEGGDWDKVGRAAIWRGELPLVAHQNHIFKARCILNEQNENWLEKFLNSSFAREYFAGSSKQTTNLASINKTQLRGCIVALPPLAEQHRIVAKVDEFMALCDAFKARLSDAQTTQLQLADIIVDQAVA